MILEGKTIVVSGVGPGLGREVARLALRDGANVVLGARRRERLEAAAKELDPSGKRVAVAATDITDAAQCAALVETAVARFGGLDGLAQVAALDALFGGLDEASDEDWRASFATNVVGPVHLVRAAAPALARRGGGSVVLIGSQSSLLPQLPQIAYASAKGALHSAMYCMAQELGPKRIRVNTVVPTWMWGPPVQGFVAGEAKRRGVEEQVVVGELQQRFPLREIPADEDVAEAVVFLLSDRARMISGQNLLVNAGEYLR
jgi:NAD(P)-dependent dehydrogenase (short-subunit alcohol dehydrogenase family)